MERAILDEARPDEDLARLDVAHHDGALGHAARPQEPEGGPLVPGGERELDLPFAVAGRGRDVATIVDLGQIDIGERRRRDLPRDHCRSFATLPLREHVDDLIVVLSEERHTDGDEARGGPDGDPLSH
jgi:hypothetical protein